MARIAHCYYSKCRHFDDRFRPKCRHYIVPKRVLRSSKIPCFRAQVRDMIRSENLATKRTGIFEESVSSLLSELCYQNLFSAD